MKIYKIIITTLFIFFNITFVYAEGCNKFDKLSKEFAKCKSELLKDFPDENKKADSRMLVLPQPLAP